MSMKLTINQHQELAVEIKKLREQASVIGRLLFGNVAKSKQPVRAFSRIIREIGVLKGSLDDIVCRDYASAAAGRIYYGVTDGEPNPFESPPEPFGAQQPQEAQPTTDEPSAQPVASQPPRSVLPPISELLRQRGGSSGGNGMP
jgi:hypothetical protein